MIYSLAWLVIKLLAFVGLLIFIYLFKTKVIDYYIAKSFYEKQGVKLLKPVYPFVGNIPKFLAIEAQQKREGTNYHPGKVAYDEIYKGYCSETGVAIFMVTDKPLLQIHNPKIVEALYTTKNKFFDKHPLIKNLTNCLTGDSILFAETTKEWSMSRKAISPAFYKNKLI